MNSYSLTLSIPLEKRQRAQELLKNLLAKKRATVKELQQLAGYLNFLNRAIFPGGVFTRRMYAKFSGIVQVKKGSSSRLTERRKLKDHHHVRLDSEFKLDCKVWLEFLQPNAASMVNHPMIDLLGSPVNLCDLGFSSDASARPDLGFGCVMGDRWLFGQWELGFIEKYRPSIEYLELFALVAGVLTWEFELKNIHLLLYCDNQAVVHMVNNITSGCEHCMHLLRVLVLNGLQFNRRLRAVYIKSSDNVLSDSLSRGQLDHFWQAAPTTMHKNPDHMMERLWPVSKFWGSTNN